MSGTMLTVWVKLKPVWTHEMGLGSGFVGWSGGMLLKNRTLWFTNR